MCDTLQVYFDQNVWSTINKKNERESIILNLRKIQKDYNVVMNYSPVSFFELIKGLKEDHLDKCKEELRLAARVTGTRLLEYQAHHVHRSVASLFGLKLGVPSTRILELIKEFVSAKSYNEIFETVRPYKQYLIDFMTKWVDSGNAMLASVRPSIRQLGADKFFGTKTKAKIITQFWLNFCDYFLLNREKLMCLSPIEMYEKLPVYRYWLEVEVSYFKRLVSQNNAIPKPSDYFDIEQCIYLDIMDYLITEDRRLIDLLNNADLPELHNRAMRLSDFLNSIPNLSKRAPSCPSSLYFQFA